MSIGTDSAVGGRQLSFLERLIAEKTQWTLTFDIVLLGIGFRIK